MRASELFRNCLHAQYIHTENGGDYALERAGGRLTIYFEGSDGYEDWKNNLDFPARAYRRMGHTAWFAHRGFVRVWKSVEEQIAIAFGAELRYNVNRSLSIGISIWHQSAPNQRRFMPTPHTSGAGY